MIWAWLYAISYMLASREPASCIPVLASEKTWPEWVRTTTPIPARYGRALPALACTSKTDWYVCAEGRGCL